MLNHPTLSQLNQLRLFGMAQALNEQQNLPELDRMTFEERLGLLVEREVSERASTQTSARLRRARLKHAAVPEDVDYRVARGLDRALFNRLLTGTWIKERQNVLITGLTGLGKTWLACALSNQACRLGYSSLYLRVPRLFEDLFTFFGTHESTRNNIGSRHQFAGLLVNRHDGEDHAALGKVAAIANHHIPDVANAFAVDKNSADRNRIDFLCAVSRQLQHITVFQDKTIVFEHADRLREPAMSYQVAVFSMDRNKVTRAR